MVRLVFALFGAAAFAASLGFFLYSYLFLFGPAPSSALAKAAADKPSAPVTLWLVNIALFTVFAAHHSVFARTSVKDVVRRLVPETLERAVYTLVASILFALVCWLWQPVPGDAWRLGGFWRWIGFGAQAAGVVLTIVAAGALDVWELAGVRQVTAASALRAPRRNPGEGGLKTDGLYGLVRHPLYFAWLLLVFGAPDMTMTRLSFAVISALYLAAAIPFEERGLIETFGPTYASYRNKVRWRMIPGIY